MTDTSTTPEPTPAPDDGPWRGLTLRDRLVLEVWSRMVDRYGNPSEAADHACRYADAIVAALDRTRQDYRP